MPSWITHRRLPLKLSRAMGRSLFLCWLSYQWSLLVELLVISGIQGNFAGCDERRDPLNEWHCCWQIGSCRSFVSSVMFQKNYCEFTGDWNDFWRHQTGFERYWVRCDNARDDPARRLSSRIGIRWNRGQFGEQKTRKNSISCAIVGHINRL